MSEARDWRFRLRQMIEAIDHILSFVGTMSFDMFIDDPKTLRAVEREFEIIGEAAKHIPLDIQAAYPSISWAGIRGFRNVVAHNYDEMIMRRCGS